MLLQVQIIQKVNQFKGDNVLLWATKCAIEVLGISMIDERILCSDGILPGYREETSQSKLPGVHHIYIEVVFVVICIGAYSSCLCQVSIVRQNKKLLVAQLAPIVSQAETNTHCIGKVVLS